MSMVPAPSAPRRAPRPVPRPAPSRPPLTVVRPRATTPARTPFVLLVAGILSTGLVTLLLLNTALSQGSFTVTDLQQRAAALADREQALAQELARNESPPWLASSAGKLGMVPSRSPVFLRTSDGKVLGEPRPGVAAPAAPAPKPPADRRPASASQPATPAARPSAQPARRPAAQSARTPAAPPAARPPAQSPAQSPAQPSAQSGGEFAVDPAPEATQ